MIPMRCCIACRKIKEKSDLIRIVADENKRAIIDVKKNINSRGIYLCKDKNCIDNCIKAIKRNKLNLKIDIEDQSLLDVLEELGEEIWED